MPHYLQFNVNRTTPRTWAISNYLLIHPFTFDNNNGYLRSLPHEARALFGLAAIQRPGGAADRQDQPLAVDQPLTVDLPRDSDLEVLNGSDRIANLEAFDVHAVSTPSSLDMSRAVIVAHARNPNTRITATPMGCRYDDFGRDLGGTRYWGAELSTADDGIMLRASLSVPTYRWDTGCLEEYLALGPANSEGPISRSRGSVFDWLVRHGARPPARLPTLTIHDIVSGVENRLFGDDQNGRAQVQQACGAVFMMNGPLVDVKWRKLARFIRGVADTNNPQYEDAVNLINSFPETELDQSVRETHLRVLGPGARLGRGGLGVSTPDFEGIMIWGLTARGEDGRAVPVHG